MQTTLQESVYETIRDRLTSGYWKPGEKLAEPKLAEELKVNRNPVREALLKLASEGMLDRSPNMGSRVVKTDVRTLAYIYQLREALETMAARLAATHIQPAQLLELEHQNNLMKHYAQEHNPMLLAKHDNTFHELLIELGGNPILMETWQKQRVRIIFNRNSLLGAGNGIQTIRRDPTIGIKAHQKIIEALRSGDPDLAEAATRAHITTASEEVCSQLADNGDKRE